ncbi:MAG: acyltransferase [Rhodospirillales bacterium]|nr:acyltransferase [Rhodospirillales bacterium]
MSKVQKLKRWVKQSQHPLARLIHGLYRLVSGFEMPVIRPLHRMLYVGYQAAHNFAAWLMRVFFWTPLFKSRLSGAAKGLNLYGGGLPFMSGPLDIEIGPGCRISTQTTFTGRWSGQSRPQLICGKNVGIGWQTTIAVGRTVRLGDNVRIAGRAFLAGYPGHPVDPVDRAAGLPDTEDQVKDIILESDVWLGTGCVVNGGVTIGQGTIVAAGSVVTKSLPPMVLAAGVPAKIIRRLDEEIVPCAAQ